MRVNIKLFLFAWFFSSLPLCGVPRIAAAGTGDGGSSIRSQIERAAEELSDRTNGRSAAAVTASLLLLGREEEFTAGQLLAISLAGSAAITAGLKYAVNRQRPTPPTDRRNSSFPSGHATAAFAAAAVCAHSYPRLTVPAYLFAGSIAYARLYLRRHYPTDVIAGALIGMATARFVTARQDRLTIRGRGLIGAIIHSDGIGLAINF